jgi:hypothetical protein
MGVLDSLQSVFAPNAQQTWEQQQHRRYGPNWQLEIAQQQAQAALDARLTQERILSEQTRRTNIDADTANKRTEHLTQMGEVFAVMKGRGHLPSQVDSLDKMLDLDANALETLVGAYKQVQGANKEIASKAAEIIKGNQEARAAAGEQRDIESHAIEQQQAPLDTVLKQQKIDKQAKEAAGGDSEAAKRQQAQKAINDYKLKYAENNGVETNDLGESVPMDRPGEVTARINKQFGFIGQAEEGLTAEAQQGTPQSLSPIIEGAVKASQGELAADDEDPTPEEMIARETLQEEVQEYVKNLQKKGLDLLTDMQQNPKYWTAERLRTYKAIKQQQQQGQ